MRRPIRRFRPRLSFANAVSVLVLFVALGGVTFAATSLVGSNGKIHGCVDKKHRVTVIKPTKKCGSGQTTLVWSQKGPRGFRGFTGPTGPGAVRMDLPITPAAASPTPATIATLGPISYRATCTLKSNDHVVLAISVTTRNATTYDVHGMRFFDAQGAFSEHEFDQPGKSNGSDLIAIEVSINHYVRDYTNGLFITAGGTRQIVQYEALADANTTARNCSITGAVTPVR